MEHRLKNQKYFNFRSLEIIDLNELINSNKIQLGELFIFEIKAINSIINLIFYLLFLTFSLISIQFYLFFNLNDSFLNVYFILKYAIFNLKFIRKWQFI